jgi:hypothetical protein
MVDQIMSLFDDREAHKNKNYVAFSPLPDII